jgi:site-specific DNA-methyltransferase (adenine-specific)
MMRPYYDDGQVTIYHGDCREILPTIAPESVDLVLTDPPYGETSLAWDVAVQGWLSEAARIVSPRGSMWCFGSMRFFLQHVAAFADWRHVQEIVWEKHNGSIFHADRFRRVHELLVHFVPRDAQWGNIYSDPQFTQDATARTARRKGRPTHAGNIGDGNYVAQDGGPRLMRSVQQVRSCHGTAIHPTQKPEGIVRPPMIYSCPVGGLVVDPFMGSGTTLAVARQEGRRAIGIELEERYCEIAVKRLQQAVLPLQVA